MPSSTRRERLRTATCEEIKATARAHMARDGAAALSLRAVASEMGLSSAALYYYYPNRDALITALIVDAFSSLGAALRGADDQPEADIGRRLEATLLAYRSWAVEHAAEYALIFGTPIPGYAAPAEVTGPEARAALGQLGALFAVAYEAGHLRFPDAEPLPTALVERAEEWLARTGSEQPIAVLHATLRAWALGHGLVSLELFNQLSPIIGPADELYRHEVRALLHQFGLGPAR